LNLAQGDIARLYERTEGWIAGLKLAALSIQSTAATPTQFIAEFTGSHYYVADYLIEEVLAGLPEEVRTFMFQTSPLGCLSGPICNAVTGQSNGQEMLEWLERSNLFTVRQDDDRRWFRYHHLFADLLRNRQRQMNPGAEAASLRKAANWYVQNNYPKEAIYMALEAQDYDLATELIERNASYFTTHKETTYLQRYLARLPGEVIRNHPDLRRLFTQASESLLTDREREVLRLVAEGASNRDAAETLVVSLGTVKKHLNNIFQKLDAQNRSQAVARAREMGYL
jgi:LuxR family maltose regulon positive regulatory protein